MSEFQLALLAQTVQVGANTAPGAEANQWLVWGVNVLAVLAVFTLPFLFGNFLAKRLRMPTIGGRIGFALFVVAVSLLICIKAGFRLPLGVDIRGGTILVYEVLRNPENREQVDAGAVVTALQNRINPSGTKEISIRPSGESQIEVVVPETDPFAVDAIKRSISQAGQLKFRIVANQRDHSAIIEAAKAQANSSTPTLRDVYNEDKSRMIGQWYEVGRKDPRGGVREMRTPVLGDVLRHSKTGEFLNVPQLSDDDNAFENWLAQQNIENIDVLMALEDAGGEPYVLVSGDDIASASFTFDQQGLPAVGFNLNTAGSTRMFQLTAANRPEGNFHRRMAIILDERVLSAPQLNSPISTNGIIEGNFTREEVEFIVSILRAGKLPAALSKAPISENRIGALLGATTIKKGAYASILSVIVTVACLLLYYRFSGIVATIALVLNGLMILAMMILIQQPLTLPGLAGMVLTLGMAVDANVLVFERMREEIAKGSTARMAIRNGFDRAFTTITDSNLTTLIAGIVLYWIGTDQIRGFAVAMIIGILISMFTAVFCARIIFDICEKMGWVSLRMSNGIAWLRRVMLGDKDLDFMSWQVINVGLSIAIIVIGLAAVTYRGREMLAIDFNGGTSATIQLAEPIEADKLRQITQQIFNQNEQGQSIESTLQRIEQEPRDTVYKIDTSFREVNELKNRLVEGLATHREVKLVTYKVDVNVQPKADNAFLHPAPRFTRLTAWQDPSPSPAASEDQAPDDQASEDQAQENATEESETEEPKADETEPAQAEAGQPQTPASDAAPASQPTTEPGAPAGSSPAAMAPGAGQQPAASEPAAQATPAASKARANLTVNFAKSHVVAGQSAAAPVNRERLADYVVQAAKESGLNITEAQLTLTPNPVPEGWDPESLVGSERWDVELPVDAAQAEKIASFMKSSIEREPVWLSLSHIGERVAGDMKQKAVAALLVSMIFIVAYIWFRFQKLAYGLAAIIALLHDVLITLGIVALCHWLAGPLGFLMIEDFKIDLIMVAAFLTIIGYSINDTIVVFDRIREVRGKSPRLTSAMVNASVNQTLSRTLLTSSTTLLTILLLYFFGGEGIHGFAFTLFVGILVGTYSSIFIASPVLLWIANRQQPAPVTAPRRMESRAV